jgi:hypothetical protein
VPSDLEAGRLFALKLELQQECGEVLSYVKQLMHNRIIHADHATLAAAAQDALALCNSLLEGIPAGCCDVPYVKGMCQVSCTSRCLPGALHNQLGVRHLDAIR